MTSLLGEQRGELRAVHVLNKVVNISLPEAGSEAVLCEARTDWRTGSANPQEPRPCSFLEEVFAFPPPANCAQLERELWK